VIGNHVTADVHVGIVVYISDIPTLDTIFYGEL